MRTGDLQENRIVRILNRVFDLMVLNVLCLITSIPIITAGTSLSALYSVTMKMSVREEGYIIRDYFRAFRKNLRTGIIETLIAAAAETLIIMDLVIIANMGGSAFKALMTGLMILAQLIWFVTVIFLFPLTAVSERGALENIRTAAVIPVTSLPESLTVIIVSASSAVLTLLNGTTIMFASVIWILIGIAAIAYINSGILRRILQPYSK